MKMPYLQNLKETAQGVASNSCRDRSEEKKKKNVKVMVDSWKQVVLVERMMPRAGLVPEEEGEV